MNGYTNGSNVNMCLADKKNKAGHWSVCVAHEILHDIQSQITAADSAPLHSTPRPWGKEIELSESGIMNHKGRNREQQQRKKYNPAGWPDYSAFHIDCSL